MRECLDKISKLIGELDAKKVLSTSTILEVQTAYDNCSEEDKEKIIQTLDELFEGEGRIAVYVMSTLLQIVQCNHIKKYIEKILLEYNFSVEESVFLYMQLQSFLFSHKEKFNDVECINEKKIYNKNIMQLHNNIINIPYIPMKYRNSNRIMLLIEPMLGKRHSPTIVLVNLYNYLQRLGYEVTVCATNVSQLTENHADIWYLPSISSKMFDGSGQFSEEYFGVQVEGLHILYEPRNYEKQLQAAAVYIQEFNPRYVISIGGGNYLAEICNFFTTVITVATTSDAPMTFSDYIMSYFRLNERSKISYELNLGENQKYLPIQMYNALDPFKKEVSRQEKKNLRNSLGIQDNTFLIVIAGNRLERELDKEFVHSVLEPITEIDSNICFLIIGKCDNFKKWIQKKEYSQKFIFVGRVINFTEMISIGNLFLNPPRHGGSGGALYALENEVPVLCLPEGDVASTVGKDFWCDSIGEMPQIVKRYCDDMEFMERQKECCRKKVSSFLSVDTEKNLVDMLHTVDGYVKSREELKVDEK